MNAPKSNPFDLHTHGSSAFVTFELADEQVSLPLLALEKASLRGEEGRTLVLSFTNQSIHVSGRGLSTLHGHLLAGRLKSIRQGTHENCQIEKIQIFEE